MQFGKAPFWGRYNYVKELNDLKLTQVVDRNNQGIMGPPFTRPSELATIHKWCKVKIDLSRGSKLTVRFGRRPLVANSIIIVSSMLQ